MIEAIPHIDLGAFPDKRAVVADDGVEHLALRPDRPPYRNQVALEPVNAFDIVRVRLGHDLFLDDIELFSDCLQHREIGVGYGIQQGIGQIIGALRPDPAALCPQSVANRLEAVSGSFLKGDDNVAAEKQADLFRAQMPVGMRHTAHDEQMILVFLHLRSLMDIDDIFQRQRVKPESVADRAQGRDIAQPIDVDPQDRKTALQRIDVFKGYVVFFFQRLLPVSHDREARVRRRGIRDQRSGRAAGRRAP